MRRAATHWASTDRSPESASSEIDEVRIGPSKAVGKTLPEPLPAQGFQLSFALSPHGVNDE